MLRKIFILALIFHFGEFTSIGRDRKKVTERFGNNENQASAFDSNNYFVNNQHNEQQQYQQQNQQQFQQQSRPQQQNQQNTAVSSQQQNQQPIAVSPQQQYQQQLIARPQQQNQQPVRPLQPQQNSYPDTYNQGIQFKQETTLRTPQNFDRTSMVSSEEFTQKPVQRPGYDSYGDVNNNNNKNNQDETSPTYPNENAGISRDQVPLNKQDMVIEDYNRPDENAIVIPNMPSKIVEIIFPPTLSYNEDASTTTRASIFDSMRRRTTTTTESYYRT
ncbi:unnamed protein product [Chironomus riparius]|uniref:Uncharacterized protein n=1 Tax=Chironomus riparius TaxID=315576 RepID=A0A9P0J0P7_9DIPT|nr:unnamed protein product [Chironomus riparius]